MPLDDEFSKASITTPSDASAEAPDIENNGVPTVDTLEGVPPPVDTSASTIGSEDENSAVQEVASYLDNNGYYVGADEDIRMHETAAASAADIAQVSIMNPPSPAQVLDDMLLGNATRKPSNQKPSTLKAALRRVLRERAKLRQKTLIGALTEPLETEMEEQHALMQIDRFVQAAFEGAPEVARAVILHFIYQVKRKLAKLPVYDHLMPVFVSAKQGVGKTRAVKRLLEPLAELSKSVLFSDIADPRSIHVFRHPVLVLDDMERLKPSEIPVVKNRVTGEEVVARGMMTNREVGVRQRATFIGTANESVMALVPDHTGHRRFYELTFRNANPATGGDPTIWDTINDVDFLAIWRLVDPFALSPLDAVRDQVFGVSGPPRPKNKVHAWALTFDPERTDLDGAVTKTGEIRAIDLYDLYCEDTRDAWTNVTEFGTFMKQATTDLNVPFAWPKRKGSGMYYRMRPWPRRAQ